MDLRSLLRGVISAWISPLLVVSYPYQNKDRKPGPCLRGMIAGLERCSSRERRSTLYQKEDSRSGFGQARGRGASRVNMKACELSNFTPGLRACWICGDCNLKSRVNVCFLTLFLLSLPTTQAKFVRSVPAARSKPGLSKTSPIIFLGGIITYEFRL